MLRLGRIAVTTQADLEVHPEIPYLTVPTRDGMHQHTGADLAGNPD